MSLKSDYQLLTHQSAGEPLRWDGHMSDGVGSTFGPEPLAFLSATRDEVLLCGNRGSFRLPRAAIRKIGRSGLYPWFFRAIRIRHDVRNFPIQLEFKANDTPTRDVLARLKAMGYPVG